MAEGGQVRVRLPVPGPLPVAGELEIYPLGFRLASKSKLQRTYQWRRQRREIYDVAAVTPFS